MNVNRAKKRALRAANGDRPMFLYGICEFCIVTAAIMAVGFIVSWCTW